MAKKPEVSSCNGMEKEGEDVFVSPELFEEPLQSCEEAIDYEELGEKEAASTTHPSLKEAITKLVTEGRLSHKQASSVYLNRIVNFFNS